MKHYRGVWYYQGRRFPSLRAALLAVLPDMVQAKCSRCKGCPQALELCPWWKDLQWLKEEGRHASIT